MSQSKPSTVLRQTKNILLIFVDVRTSILYQIDQKNIKQRNKCMINVT